MSGLFLKVLDMSATAGFAVLAVALARLPLRRWPKALTCALWTVVLIRLLCPVLPRAPFSIVPAFSLRPPRGRRGRWGGSG